jgi:predicted RNA-binding protein with PUA-like domain
MKYWLLKSEPSTYSWQRLLVERKTSWDGVRNYQACNNLKSMKVGDLGLFYHSIHEKSIQGIIRISGEAYLDPSDETGKFYMVDVEYAYSLHHKVTLSQIKENPNLSHIGLVKQSRLSVVPLDEKAWTELLEMAGGYY